MYDKEVSVSLLEDDDEFVPLFMFLVLTLGDDVNGLKKALTRWTVWSEWDNIQWMQRMNETLIYSQ